MAVMLCKRYLAAAALLLVGCAQQPDRVVERRPTDTPAPRGAALLKRTMLTAHNAARAEIGVAPLTWSDTLATSARTYAETLARTRRFEHADQPQGPSRQGENLWTGTREAYRYDEMIGHWIAEQRDFINRPTPAFSRTGKWEDVAHYTQIVWRGSAAVGCATVNNATDDYLVCRYSPAGNVVGKQAF